MKRLKAFIACAAMMAVLVSAVIAGNYVARSEAEAPSHKRSSITKEQMKDMEFGFRIAKELGRLDIGQTVVVKNMAVMALEAIEGTDACIARGGKLANGGAVVVKVAKPEQDNRFDVPTVGKATLEGMVKVGATALAIEADKTLLVEKEDVLALAKEHGITIAAI